MKFRVFILFFFSAFLVMFTGCGNSALSNNEILIVFKDYDNSIICSTKIPYGSKAEFTGETPTRESTAESDYFFVGWNKDLNEDLFCNTVFTASYICKTKEHKVTFKNHDSSILSVLNVLHGSTATYYGETPTKESSSEYEIYEFSGWDKDIDTLVITEDVELTAQFERYDCVYATFVNYDNTELYKTRVKKGEYAKYEGKTPIKESSSDRIGYEFEKWDKDLNTYALNENTTFKAKFKTIEYVYATFVNYNFTELYKIKIKKGQTPTYRGSTPTKTYSGDGRYKFSGWDKSLSAISSDTSYIAQFEFVALYTVTFKNYDGSILATVKVESGEDAVYPGSTPYRPSSTSGDYRYTYSFSGWSASLNNITSNLTVTAKYTSSYTVTGKTAVIDHLQSYGSGEYNFVSTGADTKLGYKNGSFYLVQKSYQSGVQLDLMICFDYNDSYGLAAFQLLDGSTVKFSATLNVTVSNHEFSRVDINSVLVNKYTSSDETATVSILILSSCKLTVNNASKYLSNHGLSYIF